MASLLPAGRAWKGQLERPCRRPSCLTFPQQQSSSPLSVRRTFCARSHGAGGSYTVVRGCSNQGCSRPRLTCCSWRRTALRPRSSTSCASRRRSRRRVRWRGPPRGTSARRAEQTRRCGVARPPCGPSTSSRASRMRGLCRVESSGLPPRASWPARGVELQRSASTRGSSAP